MNLQLLNLLIGKFQDGSTHEALIEHYDLQSDLATLRIPVKGLPTMKLGTSADLKPGEWVCICYVLCDVIIS